MCAGALYSYSVSPSKWNHEEGTTGNPLIQVRKVNSHTRSLAACPADLKPHPDSAASHTAALTALGDLLLRIAARNTLISCDLLAAIRALARWFYG